jgi:RNA polymerase sigma factor (sigma-70 family)
MEAFPNMETAYATYPALFCDALARLARQGFVLPPQDFEDLKHDFFAYSWKGLSERYDPACGSPDGYVYGAFVRFARQRILRTQKWRLRLRDLADLADQVAEPARPSPLDAVVRREELAALHEALAELPSERRALLLEYFTLGSRSKRQLARKYQMSRYQLDELLINGFGQLVARLGERGAWTLPDRQLAFALWCEGRELEETATRLGQPVAQVRAARERLKKLLAEALGSRPGGARPAAPPAVVPESAPP